jgi:beta-galactosidase
MKELDKKSKHLNGPALFFGACWYPDHWPRGQWDTDLRLMKEAGYACVRFGESSWTRFEPREGEFDWGFMDEVLECLEKHDLGLILGTPTYAAPAWLKESYPAAIAAKADGTRWYKQNRRSYDYTNPDYRRCCRSVVQAMAERYARDERVWAWQVDNELFNTLQEFYGETVTSAFQAWLRERYGDIHALNDAWGTMFWSCQLDDFHQADLPGPVPSGTNPHQKADYLRFISDLGIGFLHEQAAIIRSVNPQALILHNCPQGPEDRPKLFSEMDIFGLDQYPGFATSNARKKIPSLNAGEARPLGKKIWVVEQQASQPGSIFHRGPLCAPGETALLALQSVAAGADAVLWFNWRTCPVGGEMIWGGVLPSWGTPGQTYHETRELISALSPHAERIARSKSVVEVARLLNHDQILLWRCEPWVKSWLGMPWDGRAALRAMNLNEDELPPRLLRADAGYKVALLPHAVALDRGEIDAISAWVVQGGTLVVGPLAGHRDKQLHLPTREAPPGLLGELTGTGNTQDTVWHGAVTLAGVDGTKLQLNGKDSGLQGGYAEVLEMHSEDVIARAHYTCGWLSGKVAVTERPFGKGRVIHSGVALGDAFLTWLWQSLKLPMPEAPVTAASAEVEILSRRNAEETLHFVLNHGDEAAMVELAAPLRDLLTGNPVTANFSLPSRGWRIMCQEV